MISSYATKKRKVEDSNVGEGGYTTSMSAVDNLAGPHAIPMHVRAW